MFDWLFKQLSGAVNTVQNVVQQVGLSWTEVTRFVENAINTVKLWFSTSIYNLDREIKRWANDLFITAVAVAEYVKWEINDAVARVNIGLHRLAEKVYTEITNWAGVIFATYNWVAEQFKWWWNDVVAHINIKIHQTLEKVYTIARDLANEIFDVKIEDVIKDIVDFVDKLRPMIDSILLFFRNPLKAIRDLIMNVLVTWICSGLAHEIDPSISLYGSLTGPGGGSGGGEIGGVSPGQTGELAWPLDYLIISGNTFGVPPGHVGIDFHLPKGKKIYAMHDGTISVPNEMPAGYGVYCSVSGGKWRTLYGHNERIIVPNGEKVKRGQQIAIGDTTGRSTGDHLHLEIIYNGQYIDPITVLPLEG